MNREGEGGDEAMRTPTSSSRASYNIAQRKKLATPSPIKARETRDHHIDSIYSSLSSPMYSTIGSQDLRTEDTSDLSRSGLDYHSAKVAASELARSGASPVRLVGGKEVHNFITATAETPHFWFFR